MTSQTRKTCAGCLWLWRALHEPDSEQRRCYHVGSAHYHQTRRLKDVACRVFEYAVSCTDDPNGRKNKRH